MSLCQTLRSRLLVLQLSGYMALQHLLSGDMNVGKCRAGLQA